MWCAAVVLTVLICAFPSDTDELRSELARARTALAKARDLVPRLQSLVEPNSTTSSFVGYQGYTYVGASSAVTKSFTVSLWGTSSIMPTIRNVVLQQPIDRLSVRIEQVTYDSFVLTVERTDGAVGWGQEIWATYCVAGRFSAVEHPEWASKTRESSGGVSVTTELSELLHGYFSERSLVTPKPVLLPKRESTASAVMLPLLRHLGGNLASVEQLWHMLISTHPQPRRAVVVEVGVAEGTPSMYAAELGVRVLAVEPNRKWVEHPPLVAKARARPNLEIIHAAAAASDGVAQFSGGGTGGRVVVVARDRGLPRRKRMRDKRWGGGGKGGGGEDEVTVEVPSVTLDSILTTRNISHVYLVKIDVQGFELEVLRGLVRALREQRVLYVLFEFWPNGMRQHGVDAYEVLTMLHDHGYTLFDSRGLRLGNEASIEPLSAASTFRRPVSLLANVDWYTKNDRHYNANFGYWTDVLAVASGPELDLDFF